MYERFAQARIEEALADTRVVLIAGPRQAGKTTLMTQLSGHGRTYLTLDDPTVRDAAVADPAGFVRGLDHAAIDEVQRAPDLLLAIKQSVDVDRRPGRFLLTGSANIMTIPQVADSLAGRMEVVPLLPLARAEILGHKPRFLAQLLEGKVMPPSRLILGDDLVEIVLAGGYPEAIARATSRRRRDWYLSYVDAIVQRDVRDIARIEHLDRMPRLLRALAFHTGQLVNHSAVGSALGLNHNTTHSYTSIFEHLYITRTIPPWYRNGLNRLVKTPKRSFIDTGLVAALRDLTPEKIKVDRTAFGALLECFVTSEIVKQAGWLDAPLVFSHYRDKDKVEVDLVIEDRQGGVIGIEVKAAATVKRADFRGLDRLAEACGERFHFGLVLYDHEQIVPFGDRLAAAPLSCLWH